MTTSLGQLIKGEAINTEKESLVLKVNFEFELDIEIMVHPINWPFVTILKFHPEKVSQFLVSKLSK